MSHKLLQCQRYSRQQGSALVIAIFVIVVMSILAAALLRIGSNADEGINIEVWSLRAFNAANSGADAALAKLFPVTGTSSGCAAVGASWAPPDVTGFHGCRVSLSCVSQTADDVTQYIVRSTAVCETGNCDGASNQCLRVNRSVEVEARD
ncbi:MSHA biogenesis protein MshP [Shewanella sp. A32]|uniref:MSHA biogenesis protein MshP n=1 Tax=Shewanella sp. A32 TaxID=3031327 RepID=UPI0023B8EF4C|nr:MSHA biogenesis protein MshP [Shewanella sp. A32]MDF0535236.1 MSHA biogenesis protein MshP [Shewanella sp. A32]